MTLDYLDKVLKGDEEGFDLLILTCSREEDAKYWETLLNSSKGKLIPSHSEVVALTEKWEGGAGNALGTLHALEEAEKKALTEHKKSPLSLLKEGGSIALFHTAGKGSRMAPLTQAEGGMKAAIKLPAFLETSRSALTVLEMVIRQTAPLSNLSKGRLSVFWTDQLFLPSSISWEPPATPVEVYAIDLPPLTEKMFLDRKLSSYGLWETKRYFDKLSFDQFKSLFGEKKFKGALNLGSFSISWSFLEDLLKGYKEELRAKKGKLDTDPDWWMAATLPKDLFIQIKGKEKEGVYDRFKKISGENLKLSIRTFGPESDWWDFGTLESYKRQILKLLLKHGEGERLRTLFGIKNSSFQGDSIVLFSDLKQCTLKGSLIMGVEAKGCHFDHSLAFSTYLEGGVISNSLIYGTESTF